jgi:RNA ligase
MDIETLKKLEKDGWISLRKHPHQDLYIANYTTQCQMDREWNHNTIQCRGLVVTGDGRIVARPFKKFFNFSELQGMRNRLWDLYKVRYSEIWTKPFTAYEKMDGSLGIYFRMPNGHWEWATRGSFESDQSIIARDIWRDLYEGFPMCRLDPWNTYLFEIIYPENRIVVDYKDKRDLVLLSVIHTESGREFSYEEIEDMGLPFPRPQVFKDVVNLTQAETCVNDHENFEGFVLDFGEGFRCKIKSDDYVRLHKIMTAVTPRRVFECLKRGQDLSAWLEGVPDEFYQEINRIAVDILGKYDKIEESAKLDFEKIKHFNTRKSFAEQAKKTEYPGLMFKLFDGEPLDESIWRILEKEY